jgi:mono/diheme cytochrome c family protein
MTMGIYNSKFSALRASMMVPMALLSWTLLTGCHDKEQTKLQWMPDMADNPVVRPQRGYIDPPDGSVAVESMEYPKNQDEAEGLLSNPFPATNETVAKGQNLFNTFCIPCHGADAKGQGSLHGLFPQPPDITHPTYAKRKDGFFFQRITFGTAVMPGYGHSITRDERWLIIHYLRSLQQKGA